MCEIRDIFVLVLLVLCSISDIRRRGVYTWVLIALTFLLIMFCMVYGREHILSILGGIGVGGMFLAVSRLSREAIGYADSWMIALLGGYLGIQRILLLLTMAFVFAGLFGLGGFVFRRMRKGSAMPFIPFLTIAFIGVILL